MNVKTRKPTSAQASALRAAIRNDGILPWRKVRVDVRVRLYDYGWIDSDTLEITAAGRAAAN